MRSHAWVVASLTLGGCGPRPAESAPAPPAPTAAATAAPTAETTTTTTPEGGTRLTFGGSVLVGEIASTKTFDPKPALDALAPELVACYAHARATNMTLRGKLELRIQVNEAGAVVAVGAEPGGTANDPTLVACLADVVKSAHFARPGGTATILAPLIFRPHGVSR